MAARFLLIRHAQSVWNASGRWQGLADPAISELGKAGAKAAAGALRQFDFEQVISSDLHRAAETGAIIARALGLPEPIVDDCFRERDIGDWAGLTTPQIQERWPDIIRQRDAGLPYIAPNADNEGFDERALDRLKAIANQFSGNVLVVTHAGVIINIERQLGAPIERPINLSGRWLEPSDNGFVLAARFIPVVDEVLG